MTNPFLFKDCSLAVISTGESAASLLELRDTLIRIPTSCIYYHFWGERLRSTFIHPEFQNGFAKWAHQTLHDNVLAEKLGILDPTSFATLEDLRTALLEIIEERLDQIDFILWSKKEVKFHFLRSIIIVFDLLHSIEHPSQLKGVIPTLPPSSIFYHFIDARKRTKDGFDDFSLWLESFGTEFTEVIQKLREVDLYFLSLTDLRKRITEILTRYFP